MVEEKGAVDLLGFEGRVAKNKDPDPTFGPHSYVGSRIFDQGVRPRKCPCADLRRDDRYLHHHIHARL